MNIIRKSFRILSAGSLIRIVEQHINSQHLPELSFPYRGITEDIVEINHEQLYPMSGSKLLFTILYGDTVNGARQNSVAQFCTENYNTVVSIIICCTEIEAAVQTNRSILVGDYYFEEENFQLELRDPLSSFIVKEKDTYDEPMNIIRLAKDFDLSVLIDVLEADDSELKTELTREQNQAEDENENRDDDINFIVN